ncbi:hypothetical protein GCM10018953_12000 [Streptosporangium nondiastaticum]
MARTLTESVAHRDQSNSPRAPSSSKMIRYSLAHTRVALHSAKRRFTVYKEAPKTGGSCRQAHPVVATYTIAARIIRSSARRRPPPCGRVGAN